LIKPVRDAIIPELGMNYWFKKFFKDCVNLVYPISCFSCGIKLNLENNMPICMECFQKIKWNAPPYCIRCGKSMSEQRQYRSICAECKSSNFYFVRIWSCCIYEGIIKDAILRFKYSENLYLVPFFKEVMAKFIKNNIDKDIADVIIPVPLFSSRLREKGFNQSKILADIVKEILNKPILLNALKKVKSTKPQQELNRQERLSNLSGAFSVFNSKEIKNKNILLIDDVLTTGATLNECARVLKEVLCKEVFALTVARG